MRKLGVFVDVQNIYYTCRQAYNKQFNYRTFWSIISKDSTVVVANAYAIARAQDDQIKFQDALRHIGFNVKLKPFIQRSDGTAKGDWDVGITLDIVDAAPDLDEVVLLSGDGDFTQLLSYIQQKHSTRCTVYSVPQLTAKSLSDQADQHHPITSSLLL